MTFILAPQVVRPVGRPVGVAATDTAMIQDAVSRVSAAGGGEVRLKSGTYVVTGLTLPSKVMLCGAESRSTILQLAASSNTHVIASEDFGSLTGTNAWTVGAQGVPYSLGVQSLTIDGNKANNVSGHGIALFAKRARVRDVVIHDTAGDGLYSECGDVGGQTDLDDLPESVIDDVYVKWADGDGIRWRGPHDAVIGRVFCAGNGGAGFRCQTSTGVYNGSCNLQYIHAYGNDQGVVAETNLNADLIETESNLRHGLVVGASASETMVGELKAFKNWAQDSATGTAQANASVDVNGRTVIGAARIRTDYGGTGVLLQSGAAGSLLPGLLINGEDSDGLGLDIDANRVQIRADISGFTGTGGIGGRIGASGTGRHQTMLDVTLTSNTLGFHEVTAGNRNRWRMLAYSDVGQTSFNVLGSGTSNERDCVTN